MTPSESTPSARLRVAIVGAGISGLAAAHFYRERTGTKTKILILDNPTVGIDVGSKMEIHDIVRQLARQGRGVIMISDDLEELVMSCNRVFMMQAGTLATEFAGLPEDKDGFEDTDGCPDPDNDKDGIPDVSDKCVNEPETINGVTLIARVLDGVDGKGLRSVAEDFKKQIGSGVVALVGVTDGKAAITVAATPDMAGKVNAADLARDAVIAMGGKGAGGKPDFAQGGAPDGSKAEDGLNAIRAALKG